jgi:hypothetical protein
MIPAVEAILRVAELKLIMLGAVIGSQVESCWQREKNGQGRKSIFADDNGYSQFATTTWLKPSREKMALPPPFKKIFPFSLRLSFKIKDFYLKSLDFTLLQNELV